MFFRKLNEVPEPVKIEETKELKNQLQITTTKNVKWDGSVNKLHSARSQIAILNHDKTGAQFVHIFDPVTLRGTKLDLGHPGATEWTDALLLDADALLLVDGRKNATQKIAVINPKKCEIEKTSLIITQDSPVRDLLIKSAEKVGVNQFLCQFEGGQALGQFQLTGKGLECVDVIRLTPKEGMYTSISGSKPAVGQYAAMRVAQEKDESFNVYLDVLQKNMAGNLVVSKSFLYEQGKKIKDIINLSSLDRYVVYGAGNIISVCDISAKQGINYQLPFKNLSMQAYPGSHTLIGRDMDSNVIFTFDTASKKFRAAQMKKDYFINVQSNGKIELYTQGKIKTFRHLEDLHAYFSRHPLEKLDVKVAGRRALVPVAKMSDHTEAKEHKADVVVPSATRRGPI